MMENQCESTVLTADGEDIVECLRKPAMHVGGHRNWDKIKAEFPVEWKTGQDTAETSIRVPEVAPTEQEDAVAKLSNHDLAIVATNPEIGTNAGVSPEVVIAESDKRLKEADTIPGSTDVMVSVEVYAQMVDALQRIAKGPDRFGGYGPSPDGNQTPAKIAKAALEGVDG